MLPESLKVFLVESPHSHVTIIHVLDESLNCLTRFSEMCCQSVGFIVFVFLLPIHSDLTIRLVKHLLCHPHGQACEDAETKLLKFCVSSLHFLLDFMRQHIH